MPSGFSTSIFGFLGFGGRFGLSSCYPLVVLLLFSCPVLFSCCCPLVVLLSSLVVLLLSCCCSLVLFCSPLCVLLSSCCPLVVLLLFSCPVLFSSCCPLVLSCCLLVVLLLFSCPVLFSCCCPLVVLLSSLVVLLLSCCCSLVLFCSPLCVLLSSCCPLVVLLLFSCPVLFSSCCPLVLSCCLLVVLLLFSCPVLFSSCCPLVVTSRGTFYCLRSLGSGLGIIVSLPTLKLMPPEKMASQKTRFVFRPSIFRGKLTLSFKEGSLSHRKGIQNHRLKSLFGRDCDTYLHISTYTLVYLDIFHQAWIWLVISLQILPSEKILGGMSFHDGRSFRWQLTKQSPTFFRCFFCWAFERRINLAIFFGKFFKGPKTTLGTRKKTSTQKWRLEGYVSFQEGIH